MWSTDAAQHCQPSNCCHCSLLGFCQVKGKINAISVDACSRVGLLFEDLLASCEIVNSSSIEVQCTGIVPTVAVDKCDGIQVSRLA